MIGAAWKKRSILTLVSHGADERLLRWYSRLLGGHRGFGQRVVRGDVCNAAAGAPTITARPFAHARHRDSDRVRRLADSLRIGLLIADWNRDAGRLQDLLQCATDLDIPAVFVRQRTLKGIRRVLVATAGGYHTMQQLWIAKEISDALHIPLRIVHVLDRKSAARSSGRAGSTRCSRTPLEGWASRLLGIDTDAECLSMPDPVRGIAGLAQTGDLLVMGAPSRVQVAEQFDASIPAALARRVDVPLVLLSARRPGQITPRSLFWGGLILRELRPRNKRAAIVALVDALVRHHQVPSDAGATLVDLALRREASMSTAVDCETAFPHIRWPGFRGVAGSMAVCPDGVAFGSPDGSRTRFIYLLVTPDGFCEDHLVAQAGIARRMLRPEVRAALLACSSPMEVLDVLDPRADDPVDASFRSPGTPHGRCLGPVAAAGGR